MSTDKDPMVNRPGTPDPGPDADESSAPSQAAPGSSKSEATQGERSEADEPIENRFPEVEGGAQRESG